MRLTIRRSEASVRINEEYVTPVPISTSISRNRRLANDALVGKWDESEAASTRESKWKTRDAMMEEARDSLNDDRMEERSGGSTGMRGLAIHKRVRIGRRQVGGNQEDASQEQASPDWLRRLLHRRQVFSGRGSGHNK